VEDFVIAESDEEDETVVARKKPRLSAPASEGVILESDEEEDGGCCVAFRDHGSCRLGDQCRYSHDSATNAADEVVDPYAELVAVEAIGSEEEEEEEEEDTGGGHKGKRKGALTTVQSLYEYTGPQPHYGFDPERLALNTAFTNKGKRVPADLWAQMYPFQQQGVAFGVQRHGRVLIADEMGLGKSISAIATATVYLKDWPLLVLCPGSLRKNWELEFRRWVYDILIVGRTKMTPLGSKMSIEVVLDGKAKLSPDTKITIMSYDLADVYREQLQEMRYKVIICDESHYLKSPTAKRTRLLMPLLHGARRLLMLTGTPALSRPSELFTQLHALAPKAFPSLKSFCDDFCQPSSNLGRLHEQVKAVMLRRLKIDVLSLPSKIRTVTTVESDLAATGSLSRRELCDGLSSLVKGRNPEAQESPATHFIHQYQRAGISKLPAVKKYVRALAMKLPPTEKLLVFAHHQAVLDGICSALHDLEDGLGMGMVRIDGQVPALERHFRVQRFQTQPETRICVLSITACGQGLTLTAARHVVFAELYWNPGHLLQAEDRAHRIGTTQTCHVHYLLGRHSIDEMMWPLLSSKFDLLGQTLNGVTGQKFKATEIATRSSKAKDADRILSSSVT
jgi:SWI/SNF-related matrix-associated actin-dependent regulator 1 of chromatin subfamily A